jgi:hypothetical protein
MQSNLRLVCDKPLITRKEGVDASDLPILSVCVRATNKLAPLRRQNLIYWQRYRPPGQIGFFRRLFGVSASFLESRLPRASRITRNGEQFKELTGNCPTSSANGWPRELHGILNAFEFQASPGDNFFSRIRLKNKKKINSLARNAGRIRLETKIKSKSGLCHGQNDETWIASRLHWGGWQKTPRIDRRIAVNVGAIHGGERRRDAPGVGGNRTHFQ